MRNTNLSAGHPRATTATSWFACGGGAAWRPARSLCATMGEYADWQQIEEELRYNKREVG